MAKNKRTVWLLKNVREASKDFAHFLVGKVLGLKTRSCKFCDIYTVCSCPNKLGSLSQMSRLKRRPVNLSKCANNSSKRRRKKLDGVTSLIAELPPANSTTMHSRLAYQDRNLCLGKPAYLPIITFTPMHLIFRSIVALHSFRLKLCSVKYIVQ